MKSFSLQLLFRIVGIGSASGIILHNGDLYLISDNSTYLYKYEIKTTALNRIALTDSPAEQIAKKDKPDFEALTLKDNCIHVFGSGSTDKRMTKVSYDLATGEIQLGNLEKIYDSMQKASGIAADEFNIEGAVYKDNILYLFQRGNGQKSHNGVFLLDDQDPSVRFVPVKLPMINHVQSTFTDAVLAEGQLYFLAAAENTMSTYLDGEIAGCLLGHLDIETLTVKETVVISSDNKFEGLAFEEAKDGYLSFLLCEDRDDELAESAVYRVLIKK